MALEFPACYSVLILSSRDWLNFVCFVMCITLMSTGGQMETNKLMTSNQIQTQASRNERQDLLRHLLYALLQESNETWWTDEPIQSKL